MQLDMDLLRKIDRIHPYPAKFPVDLAINYIAKYSEADATIFDPFVGSGTTLLAAKVLGRNGYGTDINHIAILISSLKLIKLGKKDLLDLESFIKHFQENVSDIIQNTERFYYPSIEHWFCNNAIAVLSAIKVEIEKLNSKEQQLFCKTVFSSIINTVSNQESDTRYAAIEKPNMTIERIVDIFIKKFVNTLSLFKIFYQIENVNKKQAVILQDSKYCDKVIEKESVDLIVTSPPYPNTYDYYLYHKHRMNWLEFDVKYSMNAEIGSRREYSSLKKPQQKFDDDLYQIFEACDKLLKANGHIVIVMGDGKIQGTIYDAKVNIEKICKKLKWSLIDYSYTNLDETSRSFQQSYRTKGKKEHVLVFKKEV